MSKLSKWLFNLDLFKGMKYILWLYLFAGGWCGYSVYELYKEGDWELVNSVFAMSVFLISALYYSLIIFWRNESTRRMTQITGLILENHELKHEILILKMPNVGKKENV